MTEGIPSILFLAHQRQQLETLGLSAKQIEQLENRACPLGTLFLVKPKKMADVRDRLEHIRASFGDKRPMSLGDLAQGTISDESNEAMLRVYEAATNLFGFQIFDKGQLQEECLTKIVEAAVSELPKQSRHFLANPRPVHLIWNAIIDAHDGTTPNLIHLSSSSGCSFRQIVGICYEAMTGRIVDPERAIKKFVKSEWDREAQRRAESWDNTELALFGTSAQPKARGRPRKTNRTTRKKI